MMCASASWQRIECVTRRSGVDRRSVLTPAIHVVVALMLAPSAPGRARCETLSASTARMQSLGSLVELPNVVHGGIASDRPALLIGAGLEAAAAERGHGRLVHRAMLARRARRPQQLRARHVAGAVDGKADLRRAGGPLAACRPPGLPLLAARHGQSTRGTPWRH